MKIKNKLRTAAELTISATMIATLLAACGGGGGGAAATAAATNTMNVTPGKGLMSGATVTIKDAAGLVLGTGTTTTGGIAGVAIPATATGPFVVSVSCPATACTYYDEKLNANVPGSASLTMQAVVPGIAADIGVTAATNAAALYALNTGAALTVNSINAANATVATSLGLPAGTNLLTPPTIIGTAPAYTAAKAGTSAADMLANLSAAFAMSASGVSAMQAIADYGNAWKVAATTPATGVVMPATINAAAMISATSGVAGMTGIPTTTIPNVASTVAAAATSAAAGTAAANNLIATGLSPSGTRWYLPQSAGAGASAVVSVNTMAATATPGSYNVTNVINRLTNGVWALAAVGQGRNYNLTSTGWVLDNGSRTLVNNNNGTLTFTSPQFGNITAPVTETVLDGTSVAVPVGAVAKVYPTGSSIFAAIGKVPASIFALENKPNKVTDLNGVALTALPTLGTGFCVNGFIFNPITTGTQAAATAQGATITDNYEVLGITTGSCTGPAITTGLALQLGNANGGIGMGFATVTTQATGNTGVPSVGFISSVSTNMTNTANVANAAFLTQSIGCIMGVVGGGALFGCPANGGGYIPAGTPFVITSANKTTVDAQLVGSGFPALP